MQTANRHATLILLAAAVMACDGGVTTPIQDAPDTEGGALGGGGVNQGREGGLAQVRRGPLPAPVGVRSMMALISARRTGRSAICSTGRSICNRLIEHLMSTPTGPG